MRIEIPEQQGFSGLSDAQPARTFRELEASLHPEGKAELRRIADELQARGLPRPDAELRAVARWTSELRGRLTRWLTQTPNAS